MEITLSSGDILQAYIHGEYERKDASQDSSQHSMKFSWTRSVPAAKLSHLYIIDAADDHLWTGELNDYGWLIG